MPLWLRLAWRQLAAQRVTTVLSAVAIALPTTALIVVNVVASNSMPVYADGSSFGWVSPWGLTAAAATFAVPVAVIITLMVGAAVFVSARRHERMLALLESIGAPPGVLFRVVAAVGLVIGALAALLSVIAGLLIAYLWLGPAASRASDAHVNPLVVLGFGALAVLLGVATAIIPAFKTGSLDLVRVLRGTPRPVSARWPVGRIGRVVMAVGLGMLLLAGAALLGARSLAMAGTDLGFVGGMALNLVIVGVLQLAPFVVIAGALMTLPGGFRLAGRLAARLGTAPRLAARDAERNWGRSVPAAAAIMVTTFVIGSYVTAFGASAVSTAQSHGWIAQHGQVAIPLIDPGYENGVLHPEPVPDPEAILSALERHVDLSDARVLRGAQGPYYGMPVDDDEGFSGRQPMVFPPDGLPHPVIAEDNPCVVSPDDHPAWACNHHAPWGIQGFPLDAMEPDIWVGDAADLELILGGEVDQDTRQAHSRGDALVFDLRHVAGDGTVTISWYGEQFVPENEPDEFLPAGPPLRSETLQAHIVPLDHSIPYGIFLNENVADRLGLNAQPSRLLGTLGSIPTLAQQHEAMNAVAEVTVDMMGENAWISGGFEFGPPEPEYAWSWGALLLALGITLAVAITAVGLARIEGRDTERTLVALGADPGIRRRMSAWYTLIVVGFASVAGTLIGILPAYLGMFAWSETPVILPLLELGLLAVAVPLIVAAAAWLTPTRP